MKFKIVNNFHGESESSPKECKSTKTLIEECMLSGEEMISLSGDLAGSIGKKIRSLKVLSTEDAATLQSAINGMGLPTQHAQTLGATVRQRLLQDDGAPPGSLGSQEAALELFARPSDWTKWEDDAVPMSEKILCARDLLWDLDMVRPSEQMKARVANLLRYRACGKSADEWSPQEWKKFLEKVKAKLATKRPSRGSHLSPFPETPAELKLQNPIAYAHAYKKEEPSNRPCPELGEYPFCRSSHKTFKGDRTVGPCSLVLPQPAPGVGTELTLTEQGVAALFGKAAQHAFRSAQPTGSWQGEQWQGNSSSGSWMGGNPSSGSWTGWWEEKSWSDDRERGWSSAPAASWRPTSKPPLEDGGRDDSEVMRELERDEKALREALQARKAKKANKAKNAAADKAGAKPSKKAAPPPRKTEKGSKTADDATSDDDGDEEDEEEETGSGDDSTSPSPPKGGMKAKVALKRPASKWVPTKFPLTPVWEAGDETRKRNVFTCKWYNRAESVAKKVRSTAKKSEKEKKGAFAKAGKLWDKQMGK